LTICLLASRRRLDDVKYREKGIGRLRLKGLGLEKAVAMLVGFGMEISGNVCKKGA